MTVVRGIGTTVIEAIHLGRDAIGVEYEPRWAVIAADGIALARRHGAAGHGEVICGDARSASRRSTQWPVVCGRARDPDRRRRLRPARHGRDHPAEPAGAPHR
ncbi:MAG: hypothetical protein ACRDTS_19875 [Mycobacterium sp.]